MAQHQDRRHDRVREEAERELDRVDVSRARAVLPDELELREHLGGERETFPTLKSLGVRREASVGERGREGERTRARGFRANNYRGGLALESRTRERITILTPRLIGLTKLHT